MTMNEVWLKLHCGLEVTYKCSYHHQRKGGEGDTRNLGEVLDMSITLIVVMVSWVFIYVQTHKIV